MTENRLYVRYVPVQYVPVHMLRDGQEQQKGLVFLPLPLFKFFYAGSQKETVSLSFPVIRDSILRIIIRKTIERTMCNEHII
jgi:hypothetical protein